MLPLRSEVRLERSHRSPPVDALQQHRELRAAQRHRARRRLRPHKAAALQALGAISSDTTGANAVNFGQSFGTDGNDINVTSRTWFDGAAQRTETFGYDAFNRLKTVTGPASKSFQYDAAGNITDKGCALFFYGGRICGPSRPHAVGSVTGRVNGVTNPFYTYDLNGNLLSERTSGCAGTVQRPIVWGANNLPTEVTKGPSTLSFWYDVDKQRIRQTAVVGGSTTNVYYAGDFGRSQVGIATDEKVYLKAEGRLVATINVKSSGTTERRYVVTDSLGSMSMIFNEDRVAIERESYDPWGKRRNVDGTHNLAAASLERRGFTSHEHLDSVGLAHMNGRVYDAGLGRFASAPSSWTRIADPIGQA